MATYRLEAKIIGRSKGRSATASAAYRAAEKFEDERTGAVFDYTRKRGVLHVEVLAPSNTPSWMLDRAQLWNAVERAEKRKDAQLARDLVLSLPHELTHDQRRDLVRAFVAEEFVTEGMIADIAIHAPDRQGDARNHHAHVMLTMRELTGDGFGPKVRDWNAIERLEAWRAHWAEAVNRHLERHGHEARVDHRSLAEQGVDREPEPKQGPIATEMERDGRSSHAGDDRRAAQARNKERAAIEAELATVTADIIDLSAERVERDGEGSLGETMSATLTAEDNARHQAPAAAEQERQRRQAEQDPAKQQAQAQEAEARGVDTDARDNAERQARQYEAMREQRERLDQFEAEQKRNAEAAREDQERKRAAEARGAQAEGEIRDARDRYGVALGQHYDVKDPYGSLARAAMAEYGAFVAERAELKQQVAKEQNPEARRALELRMGIEAADYMAITDRRIASQSEVITGRRNSPEAVRLRARAAEYEAQSKELRHTYRELAAQREAEQPRRAIRGDSSPERHRSRVRERNRQAPPSNTKDQEPDLER